MPDAVFATHLAIDIIPLITQYYVINGIKDIYAAKQYEQVQG